MRRDIHINEQDDAKEDKPAQAKQTNLHGQSTGAGQKTCLDNISVGVALPYQASLPQTTMRRADVLKISS